MDTHGKDTALLYPLAHEAPEFAPHARLEHFERAAQRLGLHVHYAGAEVRTYESDEPLYYVLLSRKPVLTEEEVRRVIPGFDPLHREQKEY